MYSIDLKVVTDIREVKFDHYYHLSCLEFVYIDNESEIQLTVVRMTLWQAEGQYGRGTRSVSSLCQPDRQYWKNMAYRTEPRTRALE